MSDIPIFLSAALSPSWRAAAIACFVFLVIGIGLGAWGMHTWEVSDLRTQLALEKAKPPTVKETVKTVTDTKLQYVKGETVYLPVPGQPNAPPVATKLDGKFDIGKKEFVYTVNGKAGKFTKADDEQFMFDKNMLQLTQTSTVKIEAEIPTIDLTRHNVITLGALCTFGDKKTQPAVNYVGSLGKIGAYSVLGAPNGVFAGAGIKF